MVSGWNVRPQGCRYDPPANSPRGGGPSSFTLRSNPTAARHEISRVASAPQALKAMALILRKAQGNRPSPPDWDDSDFDRRLYWGPRAYWG
jgi:hypothetical protein